LTFLALSFLPSTEALGSSSSSSLKALQSRFHPLGGSVHPPSGGLCDLDLISLSLKVIPWLSNHVNPLPIVLHHGVHSYTLLRVSSHAILQVLATAPAGVDVNVYLNGLIVEPHPVTPGFTLDLVLNAGTVVLKITLSQGDCLVTYIIVIIDLGHDDRPCIAAGVQVEISAVTLSVTDIHGTVYPLVITPTWDGLNKWFYVAYIGVYDVTGTLSFTVTFTSSAWFRWAINHSIFHYGNPSGAITGTLIAGTNLIQLDVLQLYSCGDYIAEYSITIYQGPPPLT
jgi:hypothetical protein